MSRTVAVYEPNENGLSEPKEYIKLQKAKQKVRNGFAQWIRGFWTSGSIHPAVPIPSLP